MSPTKQDSPPFTPLAAILAVADLPTLSSAGCTALARHPWPIVRSAIAGHSATPGEVRDSLAKDRDRGVKARAFATTSNPDLLEANEATPVERAAAIASNPLTRAGVLDSLSKHTSPQVIRAVLRNPSTPWATALNAASRWRMAELFSLEPTANMSSGVGSVMSRHPQVATWWSAGTETVGIRSLVRFPEVPHEALKRLRSRGGNGSWKLAIAGNPDIPRSAFELKGRMADRRSELEDLLGGTPAPIFCSGDTEDKLRAAAVGSHTLDIHLLRSGPLPLEVVEVIIRRKAMESLVESDTLAGIIEKAGPAAARLATRELAGTRLNAAARQSEVMRRVLSGIHTDRHGMSQQELSDLVEGSLGESDKAWEVLVGLSTTWEGGLAALLETAGTI